MTPTRHSLSKTKLLLRLIGWWPPYFGTGIKVANFADDLHCLTVEMRLGFYNRNVVGVHFGGSIYSMCDPWLMLIAMVHLGNDYVVWDKAAEIKFIKPGQSKLRAKFLISPEEISSYKEQLLNTPKIEPQFSIYVKDEQDQNIALVKKTLYIKKK